MSQHFLEIILFALLIVFIFQPIPISECSQIRLEDIKTEASFFWDRNQTTQRWIPKMLVYLNNTSGMPLNLDRIEVTFSNVTYGNGEYEDGFYLNLSKKVLIPIGGVRFLIVLSEFGFIKKPVFFNLELKLHIWEAKGSIILTNRNLTQLPSIKHILEEIELQIDLLDSGQALVTYFMTFRNLDVYPVTVEVAVRYFQEFYDLDEKYKPYISDPEAGTLHVERSIDGTLLYVDPYMKEIDGRSTCTVFIRYKLKDLVKEQNSKKIVRNLRLIQLPTVRDATLKLRIPKNTGFLSLWSLDMNSIEISPPPDETYNEDTFYTIKWKTLLPRETFYVIKLDELSYSYFFDFNKLGFTLSWILTFIGGYFLRVIVSKIKILLKQLISKCA